MAFASSGLSLIAHAGGTGPSIWSYKSTDTLATISASGYFLSVWNQLNIGDEILVLSDQTTDAIDRLVITAATSTSVTTRGREMRSATLEITVTAILTTPFTLAMPACTIIRATTVTSTAFTGNTVTMALGTTVSGVDIVAATTIKAAGLFAHTVVAAAAKFAGGTLHFTATQTATATAVGRAVTIVEYIVD